VIFSNIFLPILHNIGLYIYIVKYKSGIKYLIFSGKKEEEFHAYDQNLKTFPSIFFFKKKKDLHLSHVLKIEMDIMTGL
jgi:hypothetical protein